MIRKRVVLILGAGASLPFGFPLGNGLLSRIFGLGSGNIYYDFLLRSGFDPNLISNFQRDLKLSGRSSIDAFLENNPQYVNVGKAAIAVLIASGETEGNLFNPDNGENWYKYLLELLLSGLGPTEISGLNLSIITYNYDRSLNSSCITQYSA